MFYYDRLLVLKQDEAAVSSTVFPARMPLGLLRDSSSAAATVKAVFQVSGLPVLLIEMIGEHLL